MSVARMIHSNFFNTDDTIVIVKCMQLLDASLRLLPISELVESLQSLFARADYNVSKYP